MGDVWRGTITLGAVFSTLILGGLLWWLFRRLARRLEQTGKDLNESLHGVVVDANRAIGDVRAALLRIETMETRLNATEHRLAVIERYQIRVLDAEATARGAGIVVPVPGAPTRGPAELRE